MGSSYSGRFCFLNTSPPGRRTKRASDSPTTIHASDLIKKKIRGRGAIIKANNAVIFQVIPVKLRGKVKVFFSPKQIPVETSVPSIPADTSLCCTKLKSALGILKMNA